MVQRIITSYLVIVATLSVVVVFDCALVRGDEKLDAIEQLRAKFFRLVGEGRYRDLEPVALEMVRLAERDFQSQPEVVAEAIENLAVLRESFDQYDEAIALFKRAIELRRKAGGEDQPKIADAYYYLANCFNRQAKYSEARPLYERSLAINERRLGPESWRLLEPLQKLADIQQLLGQHRQAEAMYKRALAIAEKNAAKNEVQLANSLRGLGTFYFHQRRYSEAEALLRRSLEIQQRLSTALDPSLADALNGLAAVRAAQGHYAEAEPLLKRSLAIKEHLYGPKHTQVAKELFDLAEIYALEGRYPEAESLMKRGLEIDIQSMGPDYPFLAGRHDALAWFYCLAERFPEAEAHSRRSLAIREQDTELNKNWIQFSLENLGNALVGQQRFDEAEPVYQRALAIQQKDSGANHPQMASLCWSLADFYFKAKRYAEAEPHAEQAVTVHDQLMAAPGIRSECYTLRARVSWELGRTSEALADLKQAIELAEEQRGQVSGAEHDRAAAFQKLAGPFERMVEWQVKLEDVGEAFNAVERARARSLLDEMNMQGADFSVALSSTERQQLQSRESELKRRIAELETQATSAEAGQRAALETSLADAKEALYNHYREERNNNPVYRNLLGGGAGPPRMSQLQRALGDQQALLVEYLLGTDGAYVLSIAAGEARLQKLVATPAVAKALGIAPGTLTADIVANLLLTADDRGVVQQLARSSQSPELNPRLAALWQLLVPEVDRQALTSGKYQRLIVVPDGALALLPFETLVVEAGAEPQYLLDAGPPILYGPSMTVLFHLLRKTSVAEESVVTSVLTVGDPTYAVAKGDIPPTAAASSGARYGEAGGNLERLPYSGTESRWVAKNFTQQGIRVADLLGAQATEQNVRAATAGRGLLHLACHGLTDQAYGNFFGALALTPGPRGAADAADDGFLSLPEIYQLDLKNCELAILSACQTNYGPQQKGEGVWALSRGFLVAGSRRVVASNWLVDDEAAASLVSYFTAGLAQAEKQGASQDYAQALHSAKRWVRGQKKWQSPYYWGTFVLVGPN